MSLRRFCHFSRNLKVDSSMLQVLQVRSNLSNLLLSGKKVRFLGLCNINLIYRIIRKSRETILKKTLNNDSLSWEQGSLERVSVSRGVGRGATHSPWNSELSLSLSLSLYIYIYGTLTPSYKSGKKWGKVSGPYAVCRSSCIVYRYVTCNIIL